MGDSEIKNTVNYKGIIMLREPKLGTNEKAAIVKQYLDGKIGRSEAARIAELFRLLYCGLINTKIMVFLVLCHKRRIANTALS